MKSYIIPALLLIITLAACEKEDPVIPNEEELITTLTYRLEPLGSGNVVELKFQDLDGEGGNDPIITTTPLSANTTYHGRIIMMNDLAVPPVNISDEVEEESETHQLFYILDALKVEIEYMDTDQQGSPLGLITSLSTGSETSGSLTIVLRHEPKKPNDGTLEDAGGETDIEVMFDIVVQ